MQELTIIRPDDFHTHLRQGDLMKDLVRETSKSFGRVLVMPNTIPPVVTPDDVRAYKKELQDVGTDLDFLMTFKIMPNLDPSSMTALKEAGAVAGKFYPVGVTTHSEDGVANIESSYEVFEAMQEQDLILCLHGEVPGVEDLEREHAFLPQLKKIHENFPRLRIILEHTSTKAAVEMVQSLGDKVAATITVHHLLLTTSDVRNGEFHPHNFCAPICKSESDRKALVETVLSGNPKFFLGTDSAPHLKENKEGDHPKPGVYTTPVALPLLAQLFEENGKLDHLENFTSVFGANFYELEKNSDTMSLKKEEWSVPSDYFGVVPLKALEKLTWSVIKN
ncbi:MAG: dihydroorotase [Candidatus Gracilibacteria bacterium]|nr:dihydroorotase [Candidatus Gracilibacteria bacterium]